MERKSIERVHFEAGELIKKHPPRWGDRNKRVVLGIPCSSGVLFEGRIVFARWAEEQLPTAVVTRSQFSVEPGVYKYAVPNEPSTVAWHVNFADPNLFVAYGSSLIAQDKLQVAEHPVLG
jgi:hypothetical protein